MMDIVAIAFCVIWALFSVGFVIKVYLFAREQARLADELAARGWRCVGVNFLTGPVMMPPISWLLNGSRPDQSDEDQSDEDQSDD